MSIVVAYKYAANPQDTTVGSDGVVDWSRAKAAVSEYDPVAIQVARTVADAKGEELVGPASRRFPRSRPTEMGGPSRRLPPLEPGRLMSMAPSLLP